MEQRRGQGQKVAANAQIENYLLPALKGTEAEERIKENIGYNRGRKGDQLSGARTLKAGMEVLRQLKDKQPFFLGVDAFDPHEAWNMPEAFKLRFPHHEGVEPILPFKTPNSKIESLDVTEEQIEQRARAVRRRAHLHRRVDRPPAQPARRPRRWRTGPSSTTCRTTGSCSASTTGSARTGRCSARRSTPCRT